MNNMFYILGVVRATVIHQANQCWEKFNPTKHTIQANGQWHLLKQYVRLTSFFDRISVLLFSLKTLSAQPVLSISLQNLWGIKGHTEEIACYQKPVPNGSVLYFAVDLSAKGITYTCSGVTKTLCCTFLTNNCSIL